MRTLAAALAVLATAAAAQAPAPALPAPATPAGEVTLLLGRATATDGTTFRALERGAAVLRGDTVSTAPNSYANLRFSDTSLVFLKPGTLFEVTEYQYSRGPAAADAPAEPPVATALTPTESLDAARLTFRLLKGGLRTVSGLIGKFDRQQYRMVTPVATLGIRGTDYFALVCDDACARDAVLLEQLPEGFDPRGGLVTGVDDGRIELSYGCTSAENPAAQCSAQLGAGQTLVVSSDGATAPLARRPLFLEEDPFLDPRACAR